MQKTNFNELSLTEKQVLVGKVAAMYRNDLSVRKMVDELDHKYSVEVVMEALRYVLTAEEN